MELNTNSTVLNHAAALEKIFKQRRAWLIVSSIVYVAVIIGIAGWEYIDTANNKHVWWAITAICLIMSVNWWYWTMKSIAVLSMIIKSECQILIEISNEIKNVKIIMACREDKIEKCKICPVADGCPDIKK